MQYGRHTYSEGLSGDSQWRAVLVFKNIKVISLMEAMLTKGHNFKHWQVLTVPQLDVKR